MLARWQRTVKGTSWCLSNGSTCAVALSARHHDHVGGGHRIPCSFGYRTDKNRHPLLRLWDKDREQSEQQDKRSENWSDVVRRVCDIERSVGKCALENVQGRDGMQGIAIRLAYLSGYLETRGAFERKTIDITPDDDAEDAGGDYETAGNLICLPGVKLADVLHDGGQS
jgi:hypothetical protein